MFSIVVVGVFVSLPFTIFVFSPGSRDPGRRLEAAPSTAPARGSATGASRCRSCSRAHVATVLNVIYVFNCFPIIYTLNDRNPGLRHDTTITFMYKLAFKSRSKTSGCRRPPGCSTCC